MHLAERLKNKFIFFFGWGRMGGGWGKIRPKHKAHALVGVSEGCTKTCAVGVGESGVILWPNGCGGFHSLDRITRYRRESKF